MAETIQVMVVDDSDDARDSIKLMLSLADDIEVIAEARDGAEALHRLNVITPDVVLMDINMPVLDGVHATEMITKQFPGVAVIVLSVQDDVEYVRQTMRAGAKDYLFKPVAADQLLATIREVRRVARERQSRTTVAVLSDHFTQKSKVITFISAKGGVGKSVIAVNAAVALARQGKRVVFADFDLQFGDAALMFNVEVVHSIADLVREANEIDPDVVLRCLTEHESGVSVLCGPVRPEEAEYVSARDVRVILQCLRKSFDYVIVDVPTEVSEIFLAALETSDETWMVNTLSLAVLKNNRLMLDLLADLGHDTLRIKQALNRANAKNGLKIRDVYRVLKTEVEWDMDNDYQFVETSVNEGAPFVHKDPVHKLSKQIFALTSRLMDEERVRTTRLSPLHRLLTARH